jgi:hypothetical protein
MAPQLVCAWSNDMPTEAAKIRQLGLTRSRGHFLKQVRVSRGDGRQGEAEAANEA